jgi:hypothetical protein
MAFYESRVKNAVEIRRRVQAVNCVKNGFEGFIALDWDW